MSGVRVNGAKVAALRRNLPLVDGRRHVSQTELASRVGIHPVTLSKIETGAQTQVSAQTLAHLARELGVSMEELLQGDDDEEAALRRLAQLALDRGEFATADELTTILHRRARIAKARAEAFAPDGAL